jgi:protein-tyrosine phosphatase
MSQEYIDIHNHILPGLDDGPYNVEGSLEMARLAAKNGITRIIATPHYNNEYYQPPKELILNKLEQVRKEIINNGIPVEIYSGNELRIAVDLIEKLNNQEVLSLAGSRFILLEFPFSNVPIYAIEAIADLFDSGWHPILAHCERIYDIQQNPNLLDRYVSVGCMVQINSNSLTGELGKTSYKTAVELLKRGYVDIMASDAHSARDRVPDFTKALKIASKIIGTTKAEAMVSETPAKIFNLG